MTSFLLTEQVLAGCRAQHQREDEEQEQRMHFFGLWVIEVQTLLVHPSPRISPHNLRAVGWISAERAEVRPIAISRVGRRRWSRAARLPLPKHPIRRMPLGLKLGRVLMGRILHAHIIACMKASGQIAARARRGAR